MARDSAFTSNYVWASSGSAIKGQPVFQRNTGWADQYQKDIDTEGGIAPAMSTFNQLYYDTTNLGYDLNRYGSNLPWDESITYEIGALALASNGYRYIAETQNINSNPVTIPAAYADWNLLADTYIAESGAYLSKTLGGDKICIANSDFFREKTTATITLGIEDSNTILYLDSVSSTTYSIDLPDVTAAGFVKNFSFRISSDANTAVAVTLNTVAPQTITVNGASVNTFVIHKNSGEIADVFFNGTGWVVNAPQSAKLETDYPITSKFFADSPLMVTNPDQIVPGWGVFTWEPIGTAGERMVHVIASPASIQTIGALGVNDAITGSTNGHSLTISETSQHSHYIAVETDAAIGGNPTFVTNTNSAAIHNSSSDNPPLIPYFLAAEGGSAAAPDIGLSSLAIGAEGSPHIHVLNVKCYVDYCYRRTA